MSRDAGLEELMHDYLDGIGGLFEKSMFGGRVWLLDGHLLCGARHDGALIRLGKGNDQAALARTGVKPMMTRGRPMTGWIWVKPEVFADDAFAKQLIDDALAFVRSLPRKM